MAEPLEAMPWRLISSPPLYTSSRTIDTSLHARPQGAATDKMQRHLMKGISRLVCDVGRIQLHFDTSMAGFVVVTKGRGEFLEADPAARAFSPHSAVAIGRGSLTMRFTTPGELVALRLSPGSPPASLLRALFPQALVVHFRNSTSIRRMQGLLELLELSAPCGESRASDSLFEALLWTVVEQRPNTPRHATTDSAVLRALQVLEGNLKQRLEVTELARRVGLSRAAFARRFAAAVGLPPERYLTWLRMRRAAELIRSSDARLAEIAAEVGYSSEFTFSRAFRRWYGVSPSAYRLQPSVYQPTLALAA